MEEGSSSYVGADSWKQFASVEEIQEVSEIESNLDATVRDLGRALYIKDRSLSRDPKNAKYEYNDDIKCTHLFHFSSVTISKSTTLDKVEGVELYGRIHLVDDNHDEFPIFSRERMHAQFFSLVDHSLELPVREDKLNKPRLLPLSYSVKLYLKDRFLNVTIYKGKFGLDFTGDVPFDTEQSVSFDTPDYGVVTFRYSIVKCGVMARVECKADKISNPSVLRPHRPYHRDPWAKGTISALVDPRLADVDTLSRVLFYLDCDVPHRDSPHWSSPWFPVHAYSSLYVIVDLDIDGEKLRDFVKFEPRYQQVGTILNVIRGYQWQLGVYVYWEHAYDNIPIADFPGINLGTMCGEKDLYFSDIEGYSQDEEVDLTTYVSNRNPFSKRGFSLRPVRLVEIFSIVVHHFDDDHKYDDNSVKKKRSDKTDNHMLLKGVIESRDSVDKYEIFKSDASYALIESNGVLSFSHPSDCYQGPNFGMCFELADGEGHDISKGFINMNDHRCEPWYDTRVCSVIPGDFGFAAVHYTYFRAAIPAKVNVRFRCRGQPFSSDVYGRIYARYGSYRYFTSYEKENYQSMLFEKKLEEKVKLDDCDCVHLLKSSVAVSYDDSLIVITDLRVSGVGEHILRGKSTFRFGHDMEQLIGENSSAIVSLEVSVQWGIELMKLN